MELLLDVTFVLALGQVGTLLLADPTPHGLGRAMAVLAVVFFAWQLSTSFTAIVSGELGMVKAVQLIQTALFLVVAITVGDVFTDQPGGLYGPGIFASALILVHSLGNSVLVVLMAAGRPGMYRNMAVQLVGTLGFGLVLGFAVLREQVGVGPLLGAYAISSTAAFITGLPGPWNRFGIGPMPGWELQASRPFTQRFLTVYTVGCLLGLELLEIVGAVRRITLPLLTFLALTLVLYYLIYWLYDPLTRPAERAMDPRNPTTTPARRTILAISYIVGHLLMVGGLVAVAVTLQGIATTLADHGTNGAGSWVSRPDNVHLTYLTGGLTIVLAGQAIISHAITGRIERHRLGGILTTGALLPVLASRPTLLTMTALFSLCFMVRVLDHRHPPHAGPIARTARRSAAA